MRRPEASKSARRFCQRFLAQGIEPTEISERQGGFAAGHPPPAVDVARSNVRRIACLRFNAPDGLRQQKGRILRFAAAPVRSWCPNKRRTARASPVRSDEPRMPRSGCLQNPSQHQSGRRRYLPFRAAHTIQSQPFILPFNIEASKEYPWLKTISGVQCTFRCRRF